MARNEEQFNLEVGTLVNLRNILEEIRAQEELSRDLALKKYFYELINSTFTQEDSSSFVRAVYRIKPTGAHYLDLYLERTPIDKKVELSLNELCSLTVSRKKHIYGNISLNKNWITYYFDRDNFEEILNYIRLTPQERAFILSSVDMLGNISKKRELCIDALSSINKEKDKLRTIIAKKGNNALDDYFAHNAQKRYDELSKKSFNLFFVALKELDEAYSQTREIVFDRLNALYIFKNL